MHLSLGIACWHDLRSGLSSGHGTTKMEDAPNSWRVVVVMLIILDAWCLAIVGALTINYLSNLSA